jgi:hypothetical protein
MILLIMSVLFICPMRRTEKENLEKIDDDESTNAGDSEYHNHDDDDESTSQHRTGDYEAPKPEGELA